VFAIVSHRNLKYKLRRAPAAWKDAICDSVRIEAADIGATADDASHWASDKVKVQVYCGALNYFDLNRVYAGLVGAEDRNFEIIGSEIAGRVLALGREVNGFREGDLVVTRLPGPCLECLFCAQGRPGCKSIATKPVSAFQQEVWISAKALHKIERGVTPLQAVTFQFSGSIALQLVEKCFPVGEGERVLITAANSAAGAYVTQLAARRGATTVALTRSPDTLPRCRANGAAAALATLPGEDTQALRKRIGREAGIRAFDKAFDFAVDFYSDLCLELVRAGGAYVFAGKSGSASAVLQGRDILELGVGLEPYQYSDDRGALGALKKLAAGDAFPVIDSIFKLDQAAAACSRAWWSTGKYGKVLLTFVEPGFCEAPTS
jgi:NADPH:quinone reductase-like Zn-dependent oxidoreductase